MWKAYAERALEAYGRAYIKAKGNQKLKPEVVSELKQTLTQLYKLLHNGETAGLLSYVETLKHKQFTNPDEPILIRHQ